MKGRLSSTFRNGFSALIMPGSARYKIVKPAVQVMCRKTFSRLNGSFRLMPFLS